MNLEFIVHCFKCLTFYTAGPADYYRFRSIYGRKDGSTASVWMAQ